MRKTTNDNDLAKKVMALQSYKVEVYDGVLFCAFRYALGRMTYVVSEVADAIQQNARNIQPKLRRTMIEEITESIKKGHAGMDMDIKKWEETRKVLEQSLGDDDRIKAPE